MIRNYFKIAFRNLLRNKLNSFINLIGLSLGLAACILIMMYVSHEKSYDQFHQDSDRIFNAVGEFKIGGEKIRMTRLSASVASQLKENDAHIEEVIRYYESHESVTLKTGKSSSEVFPQNSLTAADSNLFSFFSFDIVQGNASSALENPFSVVLTMESAEKYFGKTDPIGKQLIIKQDSSYNFTVTGVMKNFPSNSSINSNVIVSMSSLPAMAETKPLFESSHFQGGSFATYLKLYDSNKVAEVEKTAIRLDKLGNEESNTTYVLDLFTNTHSQNVAIGRFNYLDIFPIVALLILILALTNYISLTTARSSTRAKEVGIRKISGANRKSLALQFYTESAIFVCISFALGILISVILKDKFLDILQIEISNSFFFNWSFVSALIGLLTFAVLTSGIYPAFVLSSFNPIKNFKNNIEKVTGSVPVRKVFTTLQFTIAVLLIICGIVMGAQLDFMRNKDTGLVRSNIVMIPVETTMSNNAIAFRNDVNKMSDVEQTTLAMSKIYGGYNAYFASKENSEETFTISTFNVDEHFIETLGVSWYLPPEQRTAFSEENKVIINQKTIANLALKPDPRGEQIKFGNQYFEVAGVVNDFNYASLENPIKPLAFFISSEASANTNMMGAFTTYLYVKLAKEAKLKNVISNIENSYVSFDETTPFSYQFMDDAFDKLYKAEERLSYIFYIFMILALVIAGLGLLGLVTFMAEKRVKEIGVRKVLGASVSEIVVLLSSDFLKLILLAILIAMPLAWYFSDNWLSYFTYKISVPWWAFATAGLTVIILSIVTLSIQGVKSALANPVDALRSE